MPGQTYRELNLKRMLVLASAAVVTAIALSLALIKVHLDEQDEVATQLSEYVVNQIRLAESKRLASQAKDYAYWDDSVRAVNESDMTWAEENYGSYLLDTFDLDFSIIATSQNQVFYTATRKPAAPGAQQILKNPAVQRLLAGAYQRAGPEPIPVAGTVRIDRQLMMIAIAQITPDDDMSLAREPAHALIIGRLMDADYLAGLEHLLGLQQMTIGERPLPHLSSLAVLDSGGTPVGYLRWQARQPDRGYSTLALIFIGFTLMIVTVSVGLLWQLQRLARHYAERSLVDDLTGLHNRRYFNRIADQEMRRLCRDDYLIGFLMIDVDNFKRYNDLYGHQAGDAALRRLADTMSAVFSRASDHVCRLGGEEFGIVFIGEASNQIMDQAEELRERIEGLAIPHAGNAPFDVLTVSIGGVVARARQGNCDVDTAYRFADRALYLAKQEGRNSVHIDVRPA